jgi:hypothetical protein
MVTPLDAYKIGARAVLKVKEFREQYNVSHTDTSRLEKIDRPKYKSFTVFSAG